MNSAVPASDALIRAERVRLGYGNRVLLDDVAIEIRNGEFWFFLGGNGTGKTTLLRAMLGLIAPLAGTFSRSAALSTAGVGFVPQHTAVNRNVPTTVREFVCLGLVGTGVRRHDEAQRLAEALAAVQLTGREREDFGSLSGGLQQRALIARALIRRPLLLLLDEPTNNLDPPAQEGILQALAEVNRRSGVAILFVTHDLGLATRYGSHVAFFAGGAVTVGQRDAMLTPERLRSTFGDLLDVHRHVGGHEPAEREERDD